MSRSMSRTPFCVGAPLAVGAACMAVVSSSFAQPQVAPAERLPYVEVAVPSPEESRLDGGLAVGPDGYVAAVGDTYYPRQGGSWSLPLFLEKPGPLADWREIPSPNFGMAPGQYHRMHEVVYLPNGDLVGIGRYTPDPRYGNFRGTIMHYHRATQEWSLNEIFAPGVSSAPFDLVLDPFDPDRLLMVGVILEDTPYCIEYYTLVVEYRPSLTAYSVLPISFRGDLRGVVALEDGTFLAVGVNSDPCAFTADPRVMLIDGNEAFLVPDPPLGTDLANRRMQKAVVLPEGKVLIVGYSSANDLGNFKTMAHILDPRTLRWQNLEPLNPEPYYNFQFWDVAVRPDGRAHAVGRYTYRFENRFHYGPLIQSFDGRTWRHEGVPAYLTEREYTRANTQLWCVAALPDGTVYTGGRLYRLGTPYEGCSPKFWRFGGCGR